MSGIVNIGLRLVRTTKNKTNHQGFMYHVRNGFCSHANKSIPPAQKKSGRLWNTIKICSVGLSIIGLNTAIYYAYKIKADPKLWEANSLRFAAIFENLKYSITPSKIITSRVLFNDSEIKIRTLEENITCKNENTRNLIINEELEANIQKPFPRGEPIPVKIGKYTGSLDNGKLILKTEDGETTFTFDHEISFKVKKSSGTLQNEFADSQKLGKRKALLRKVGVFNVLIYSDKLSLITSEGEKKWFCNIYKTSEPDEDIPVGLPEFGEIFPRAGSFIYSLRGVMKIQADNSDEVFYFKHRLSFKINKNLDENLRNKLATEEEILQLIKEMESFSTDYVSTVLFCHAFHSGTIVFKTQDDCSIVLRQKFDTVLTEKDGKIDIIVDPRIIYDYVG